MPSKHDASRRLAQIGLTIACLTTLACRKADGPSSATLVEPPQGIERTDGFLDVRPTAVDVHRANGEAASRTVIPLMLKNTGNATLKVLDIETTCGCATPQDIIGALIDPGDELQCSVQVSVPLYGDRSSRLTILTDSTHTPRIDIPVSLHGSDPQPPYIASAPAQVQLTGHRPGVLSEKTFVISAVELPGTKFVTGIQSANDGFQIELLADTEVEELTSSAQKRWYEFKVISRLPEQGQVNSALLTFTTSGEPRQKLPTPIRVSARTTPPVRVVPERVVLSDHASGGEGNAARALLLLPDHEQPWSVEVPPTIPSWIAIDGIESLAEISHGPKTVRLQLMLQNADFLESTSQETTLSFRCSHPSLSHVEVPFTVVYEQ